MTFNQMSNSSPQGTSFLVSDIMPWEDYVIIRVDDYTSVAVYGSDREGMTWKNCTVREIYRNNVSGVGSNVYYVDEYEAKDVTVNVSNPYYAYGNVIGVNYALPVADNLTCMLVASCFVICSVLSVFRTLWTFRKVSR